MVEFRVNFDKPIEDRMEDFKNDSEKMRVVDDFLVELLEKAKIEAERRASANKKLDPFGIQNGTKRIGAWSNRARSSARSFATRVFTAICNCTTTVRNATNAAINRN